MCVKAVSKNLWKYCHGKYKTQEICDKVVDDFLPSLKLVPDCFLDPDTTILVRHLAWHSKFEKRKQLKRKISEELMTIVWHTNRWWDWCVSEEEKKEIDPLFIEEL